MDITNIKKGDQERLKEAWKRLNDDWPNHDDVTTPEVMEHYDRWDLYDEDMEILGYEAPAALVSNLNILDLKKDALILELGCGTGILGKMLQEQGYTHVHGHDGSPLLLKKAEEKEAYEKYIHCLMGKGVHLPAKDGKYDAVLSAGGLSPGHFSPDAIHDMFRVIKPGGYFAHVTRDSHLNKRQLSGIFQFLEQQVKEGLAVKLKDEVFGDFYTRTCGPRILGRIQIVRKSEESCGS